MNKTMVFMVFFNFVYAVSPMDVKTYRDLGGQSVFEKKHVMEYEKKKEDEYDFEKKALVFRGFGSPPYWDELAVLRINCFRLLERSDNEWDPITFFNVIPARALHSRIKHELSTNISIPFESPERPSSVVFRVVPSDYTGTINGGVLIEGGNYVFTRRHHNIEFIDIFTVPKGLKSQTVTTFNWNIENPITIKTKEQSKLVRISSNQKRLAATQYLGVYVAVAEGTISREPIKIHEEESTITLQSLGGDLLLQDIENNNRHWIYIRSLQKSNISLPEDADLVLTSENGISLKFEVLADVAKDKKMGIEIYAHDESILPVVYDIQYADPENENTFFFNFILPKSEYIFRIFSEEKRAFIHKGTFRVEKNQENYNVISLLPEGE